MCISCVAPPAPPPRVLTRLENLPDLVPHTLYEARPQYLVHCGLVFTPLTEPYLQSAYTREWEIRAPVR